LRLRGFSSAARLGFCCPRLIGTERFVLLGRKLSAMPTVDKPQPFRVPTGTRDVLPPESQQWDRLLQVFSRMADLCGYEWIMTPIFEDAGVFSRAVGDATDIVRKEMYDFDDKGGRHMSLRPEVTASVVRSFVENRPPRLPWKVWYWGPMFRYERPQAGRYRQFYQVGAEAIGSDDPELDIEMIVLVWDFFTRLGLNRMTLKVNSLGDSECRPKYRAVLEEYLDQRKEQLCDEHAVRYLENPMRVLDCKKEPCRKATQDAPKQLDWLCESCASAFESVRSGLDALEVPYTVDHRLVRGLDYYTRTTFEISADALESAQNAIGGGGRYDKLVSDLGGPPSAAVGFSSGIERVLLACQAEDILLADPGDSAPQVFLIDLTGGRHATVLARRLRTSGIKCERDLGSRSAKAQFRSADRSGARIAAVIGSDELQAGTITVKSLIGEQFEQHSIPIGDLEEFLSRKAGNK
ncbi:MAG TPA: histidine--tRNA ligase, partial [Acidimicrobiales bacterium]|nr:histidine--tRNA ligase [Acidimicrobiales bacterium]